MYRFGRCLELHAKKFDRLIDDLAAIQWRGRNVNIVLDSDAVANPQLAEVGCQIGRTIKGAAMKPNITILPGGKGKKMGLDDHQNPRAVLEMPAQPELQPLLSQHKNDLGNAERLITFGRGNLRYIKAFGRWAVYNSTHWPTDDREQEDARALAHEMLTAYVAQANKCPDTTQGAAHGTFAFSCMRTGPIDHMLREAQPNNILRIDELDKDHLLVNFRNGTFDTRTQKLRAHSREDFITGCLAYDYSPKARCPQFEKFICDTFGGDKQVISFVQTALGYSLTGDVSEKCLFIAYGETGTAKTTLLTLVYKLLGAYAQKIKVESLMVERGRPMDSNANADLADLRGKRFVSTSEVGQNQKLREELVKLLSAGMGDFRAVRKYENPITFTQSWKIWVDSNYLPVIRGTDDALWSRLVVIPFARAIPKHKKIPHLDDKLIADEAPGILAWLVQGLVNWQKQGLKPPALYYCSARRAAQAVGRLWRYGLKKSATCRPAPRNTARRSLIRTSFGAKTPGSLKTARRYSLEKCKSMASLRSHSGTKKFLTG
jgi:putative DNA primase/helicase